MAVKFLLDLDRDGLFPRWSPRHGWYVSPEGGIRAGSEPVPIRDSSGKTTVGQAKASAISDRYLLGEIEGDWATLVRDKVIQRAHVSVEPATGDAIEIISDKDLRLLWDRRGIKPDEEAKTDLRRVGEGMKLVLGTVSALHLDALGIGASRLAHVGKSDPEASHKDYMLKKFRQMARESLEMINSDEFSLLGMNAGLTEPEESVITLKSGQKITILRK